MEEPEGRMRLVSLADVQPAPISWLWPGRIPRGKLTLLVGDAGLGKSFVTLDLAARLSTGRAWPDGTPAPVGDVYLLGAEDGLSDTIRPRLDAMSAEVRRVRAIVPTSNAELDLRGDLEELGRLARRHRPAAIVIDPLTAYLGNTDAHRDGEVRAVLAPVAHLAEELGVAIIAVMHLRKGEARRALHRVSGSIAFAAAARAVFAVEKHPRDPGLRVLLPVKLNVAAFPPGLAFRIKSGEAGPTVAWDPSPIDLDADDVMGTSGSTDAQPARAEAISFLLRVLADGPVRATDCYRRAAADRISERTLKRAKGELGVQAAKRDPNGAGSRAWWWSLPADGAEE